MEQLPSESDAIAKVSSIFIYPIKSCRGISVSQSSVTPTGFRWDRQWLVVNYKGRAYTQRVEPKLSLVQVELPDEAFIEGWEPSKSSYLVLKAPGMDALKVSLIAPREVSNGVSVWEWSGSALDEGADASKWFSDYLGKPSRLVRFNTASEIRPVEPEYARGHKIMFSDMYPYMLLSQGSMDALNNVLKEPIPVNRFRPNILVEGCEPFSEDLWTEIRIDKLTFLGVKLCSRCKVKSFTLSAIFAYVVTVKQIFIGTSIYQQSIKRLASQELSQMKLLGKSGLIVSCVQLKNRKERSTLGRI
ncbi:PREDICTED: mitochondrial amidoxime reducing component 2 isoform X2 [Prunus mume]|uniref:Mitochondrial amidoxime reducing component 2 isoform X2 n=1 Tax=Prunus mume TaxID=102107 RepID=A0ABM1LKV5_PRUMU|nr:PREDICTED: mitochondrial amidoxime reducing component 2 isoform X2 [Prunus mume]